MQMLSRLPGPLGRIISPATHTKGGGVLRLDYRYPINSSYLALGLY